MELPAPYAGPLERGRGVDADCGLGPLRCRDDLWGSKDRCRRELAERVIEADRRELKNVTTGDFNFTKLEHLITQDAERPAPKEEDTSDPVDLDGD